MCNQLTISHIFLQRSAPKMTLNVSVFFGASHHSDRTIFVRKSCNQHNIILAGLWQAEQILAAHRAGAQKHRDVIRRQCAGTAPAHCRYASI
jgi:hypothetical protein